IDRLTRAREIGLARGMRYVYLGNVFDHPGTHTYCPACGARAVTRMGMTTRIESLRPDGGCAGCGEALPFRRLDLSFRETEPTPDAAVAPGGEGRAHSWDSEILSVHVEAWNTTGEQRRLRVERVGGGRAAEVLTIRAGGG